MENKKKQIAVIGAGPGGYAAAFRSADLGYKVTLIDKNPNLGGVCLNVGCIPSKALLHITRIMDEAIGLKKMGVTFDSPKVELDGVRNWKINVISQLNKGISALAKARNVEVITGVASFSSNSKLNVKTEMDDIHLSFDHCIIATGSSPTKTTARPGVFPVFFFNDCTSVVIFSLICEATIFPSIIPMIIFQKYSVN